MEDLGYNYRITDFQCALGMQQLDRLDSFLERREAIARTYHQAFLGLPVQGQAMGAEGVRHAWHIYALQLDLEQLTGDRRTVFEACQREGLDVNVHYLPIHLHPFYRQRFSHRPGTYPVAERYYARAMTLPAFPRMTDTDVQHVVTTVRKVLQSQMKKLSGEEDADVASTLHFLAIVLLQRGDESGSYTCHQEEVIWHR